jgi:hypothetical protein
MDDIATLKDVWYECLDQWFPKCATQIQKAPRSTGYPWIHFCNG